MSIERCSSLKGPRRPQSDAGGRLSLKLALEGADSITRTGNTFQD
jgi:hypothetical protein